MSSGLDIAAAAIPQTGVVYGPWQGSYRSRPKSAIERNWIYTGLDFLYEPRSGYWLRRGGKTIKFDTGSSSSPVGRLPAKWGALARHMTEFISDSNTDGIPSLICLLTKETLATSTNLDDGFFSNVWWRDQVNTLDRILGDDYSSNTYPAVGTQGNYLVIPVWYDSGQGGSTRGVDEFHRRLFACGSRGFLKVGNWWYFPNLKGTPFRWNGNRGAMSSQTMEPSTDSGTPAACFAGSGATPLYQYIDEVTADDSDYVRFTDTGSGGLYVFNTKVGGNGGTDPISGATTITFSVRAKASSANNKGINVYFGNQTTNFFTGQTYSNHFYLSGHSSAALPGAAGALSTSSFTTYTYTLSGAEMALVAYSNFPWIMTFEAAGALNGNGDTVTVSWVQFSLTSGTTTTTNRLIPSGPLPPTHAGTLAAGTQTSSNVIDAHPASDISVDSWVNQAASGSNLYQSVDEVSPDDTDYIISPADGASHVVKIKLGSLGFTPAADTNVQVLVRHKNGSLATVTMQLVQGASTTITTRSVPISAGIGASFQIDSFTLTASEISSVSDWTDLRVWVTSAPISGLPQTTVSYIALRQSSDPATTGGWMGSDKFYYSVAYRFEDDSIWMPCTPRGPSANLANGYNLFTVDSTNLSASYQSVAWSNIPIGPYGVKSRILLRTPKIDSSTDSTLQLNATDLRVVWEIKDNTTTSYTDFAADDDALVLDVDHLLIRDDHIMPPRSRYIFGGDSRVCHSYGGLNPSAIILAPVGRAADYDLNSPDSTATLYTGTANYFKLTSTTLTLLNDDGTPHSKSFTLSSYPTIQDLVDVINATAYANDHLQWRAQLAPGANPQAATTTALAVTSQSITSVVISGTSLTKAAGGLSNVPVGAFITGTGITDGTYVTTIVSDTSLTMSASGSSGTQTLTFVNGVGDTVVGATHGAYEGYQRVVANSLPGFIYFNKTYLNQFPIEKNSVWMTVASPGAIKSAANSFSGRIANKHTPPLEAGISMGGVGIDNGFVVPFSKKRAVIRNTRDFGTGLDSDYRLFITNEGSGCCAWQTVTGGTRVAVMFSPEGFVAQDLQSEALISDAIWQHAPNALGDFTFEAPLCIAATARDIDYDPTSTTIRAGMTARIMRNALWVSYRTSGTVQNRMVVYDFSSAPTSNGLAALLRGAGDSWGWSVPQTHSFSALAEGRRSDGNHIYGWDDTNSGSTGDGRIDEFETGTQDNGTDIAANLESGWERMGGKKLFSAQEFTLEHGTPSGATVSFQFHRSFQDDSYTLTPSTSSQDLNRDIKMLTLPARAPTAASYWKWLQTAGSASELREVEMRAKVLPSFK